MNLQDGKLCLSQTDMRSVVAEGLKSVFVGRIDVKDVSVGASGVRPFEIILGEPLPPKKEAAKK